MNALVDFNCGRDYCANDQTWQIPHSFTIDKQRLCEIVSDCFNVAKEIVDVFKEHVLLGGLSFDLLHFNLTGVFPSLHIKHQEIESCSCLTFLAASSSNLFFNVDNHLGVLFVCFEEELDNIVDA